MVIDYHLGLSCTALDACRVLKNSLKARWLTRGMAMPKLRTDNRPQFIARKFEETCLSMGAVHERTPVKTPNFNTHIRRADMGVWVIWPLKSITAHS